MLNKYATTETDIVGCSYCQLAGIETPAVVYWQPYNGEKYPAICPACLEAMGLDASASLEDVEEVWASGFEF